MSSLGTVAAKCVNRSGSSQCFTPMRNTTWDEVFLPGPHRNPRAIDDQGIATLDNHHVFVVIVGVWRGCSGLTAGPKSHLASVCSLEDEALYSWSRLIGLRDLVGGMLHEFRKIYHGCNLLSHFHKTKLEVIMPLYPGSPDPRASRLRPAAPQSRRAGRRSSAAGIPGSARPAFPAGPDPSRW